MKSTMVFLTNALLATLAFFYLGCQKDMPVDPTASLLGAKTQSQTGQGIGVNFGLTEGVYSFANTTTYRFNKDEAAKYFTNTWDGKTPSPTPTTKSTEASTVSPTSVAVGSPCVPDPNVPNAPDPDGTKLVTTTAGKNDVVGDNKCNFLDGLALQGLKYTQDVTTMNSCSYVSACTLILHGPNTGKYSITTTTIVYTWVYTFTYIIVPIAPGQFEPFTAWDVVNTTGNNAVTIPIAPEIYGESAVKSSQFPTGKYSFSLLENDGITNRVQNLAISIDGVPTYTPGSTVVNNAPGALAGQPGAVDFTFTANAGTNGAAILIPGDARGILNGTVSSGGLVDQFKGNNDGGSDGTALAKAVVDQVVLVLGSGTHDVTLTGVVKGNSATADQTISVTKTVTVVTPGCGTNPN